MDLTIARYLVEHQSRPYCPGEKHTGVWVCILRISAGLIVSVAAFMIFSESDRILLIEKTHTMRIFVMCAIGTVFGLSTFASETKVNIKDLPPAVQIAVRNQTKGATILGASKEREHGRMSYEVETKQNGKRRDLAFAENGSLLEIEQEIDLNSIPVRAKEAIQNRADGGTIMKVESVTQWSSTSYEATVKTKGGKYREVAVNADGSPHKED